MKSDTALPNQDDKSLNNSEFAERLRLLYSSSIPAVIAIYVATILLSFILSTKLPHFELFSWGFYMLLVGVFRFLLYFRYKKSENACSSLTWRNYYIFASFLTGLGWTFVAILFVPAVDPVYQLTIAIVIIAYLAGATTTQFPMSLSFYALFILPISSLIFVFFKIGGEVHTLLGFMLFIFLIFVLTAVKRLRALLVKSLQLRFDNESLAEKLLIEKKDAEQLNQTLKQEINNRKKIETGLIEARNEADKANAAKTEFLSTMSHEIRTPMNGVIGMTNLLKDTQLDEEQRLFVGVIQQSGDAMLNVINDILDFTKLTNKKIELEEVEFNLAELCKGVTGIYMADAEAKNLSIDQNYSPRSNHIFKGDIGRIRQILMNLVGNALKFTHQGSLTIKIDAEESTLPDSRVRFEVHDTGIGIAEENKPTLFDSFVQADASITRKYGGSGLGLAICKELAHALGGKIGVESELGNGSLFWFELPLIHIGEDVLSTEDEIEIIYTDKFPLISHHLRVLVAEDVLPNQLVARKLIEKLGHRVDIAANGLEAVQAVQNRPYDLVFMDVRMPEMDGLSATREIKELGGKFAALPIIAMTANATQEDKDECMKAGMSDFVSKPIILEKLKSALQGVININQQTDI